MSDRQKTKEEYVAAAMLLGVNYDEQINTFYKLELDEPPGAVPWEVDADTMEPLDAQEINRRYMAREGTKDIASYDDFEGEFYPTGKLP